MYKYCFLFALLLSCKSYKKVDVLIENTTLYTIDTCTVFLNASKYKFVNITSKEVLNVVIPLDSLKINNHDFIVQASCIAKTKRQINGFYYSDLGGIPNEKFSLIITDSIVIIKGR